MNQGGVIQGLLRVSVGVLAVLVAVGAQAISVGPSGQASYSVPLSVPPGVAGMNPNLGLSYADGGINGPLGVGWSLQGVSTVTRCPSSRLIDGEALNGSKVLTGNNRNSVKFNGNDRLCLDGQRLIAVDATTGAPLGNTRDDATGLSGGSCREFRTEKDSFSRIRACGSAVPGTPDAGPAYLKVWTKNGQVYEYGLDRDSSGANITRSRINAQGISSVAVWAVSRISDSVGNYIDFKYEQLTRPWGSGPTTAGADGLEWNLLEVQYTGNANSGALPANKVVFEYEDRDANGVTKPADRSEAYQGDSKNISVRRLKTIRTYVNSANPTALGKSPNAVMVRAWVLAYEPSPRSGRSRLTSVKECSDVNATKCLPSTTFAYSNGAAPNYVVHAGFANTDLSSKVLTDTGGMRGNLTGDFNGDGKTDIIRWSDDPSQNELYFSAGDGAFTRMYNFNLNGADTKLFDHDGCYSSIVMDFNGDGRSDILRIRKPSCTSGYASVVFISNGDGTFTSQPVLSSVDFEEKTHNLTTTSLKYCDAPPCSRISSTEGKRFFLFDVNSDGIPDIVTTKFPSYSWLSDSSDEPPNKDTVCANGKPGGSGPIVCTHVYLGRGDGTFVEMDNHPNAYQSLYGYSAPNRPGVNPYWSSRSDIDADGDGLMDLVTRYSGVWRNRGDGTFEKISSVDAGASCTLTIDFNGDQRRDCLRPDATPANQALYYAIGASTVETASFNLKSPGDQLYAVDGNQAQTIGVLVEDIDGDGRQDILRWSTSTADNGVYLSNGDGSFRPRLGAGLNNVAQPLISTNGGFSFITGDFLGNGSLQIMQLRTESPCSGIGICTASLVLNPKPTTLLVLDGDRTPVDQLVRVVTGSGVSYTVVAREPLTTSRSYVSDRGTSEAAVSPMLDVQAPLYVITGVTKSNASYGDVQSTYSYAGLKADRNGRGILGYREFRQEGPAPDGQNVIRVVTRNLLTHPYIGSVGTTETYVYRPTTPGIPNQVPFAAQRLARTTYSYCDMTSSDATREITVAGTSPVPCATTALVQKPYLYQTLEERWDLNDPGLKLPDVRTSNTYNTTGDPTKISITTSGTALTSVATGGAAPGLVQTFTKVVDNTYLAPNTSGDNWILGRLDSAKVTQTAPNSLASIATTAGGAARASQRDGNGPITPTSPPPPTPLNPAVLNVILSLLLDD